jgi:hypothetical protein
VVLSDLGSENFPLLWALHVSLPVEQFHTRNAARVQNVPTLICASSDTVAPSPPTTNLWASPPPLLLPQNTITPCFSDPAPQLSSSHHNNYFLVSLHVNIAQFLAMPTSYAIGALILIPIIIAGSAAYIALQTVGFFKGIHRRCSRLWQGTIFHHNSINNREPRRKLRRSNLSSSQLSSWHALGSLDDLELGTSPRRNYTATSTKSDLDLSEEVWHPTRSTRMRWSFSNPRSSSHNRSGSSNAPRPLPAARVRVRSSV